MQQKGDCKGTIKHNGLILFFIFPSPAALKDNAIQFYSGV